MQAADADRSDTGARFIRELMSKSTYFLVLMQCAAGRYGRAADRLRALIEAGGEKYYLSWAKKTLKGIEAASPDPETTGGAS
jgi:hypothetical protein